MEGKFSRSWRRERSAQKLFSAITMEIGCGAILSFLADEVISMLALLKKPILLLPLFVIISRSVEEAYPISHFPMYATLDREPVWYVYLADGETGEALPMEHLVGVRPAAAKKMFRTRLRKRAEVEGLKKDDYELLPESARAEVARAFLGFLRKRGEGMALDLPSRMALGYGKIMLVPGEKTDEVLSVIATEKVDGEL